MMRRIPYVMKFFFPASAIFVALVNIFWSTTSLVEPMVTIPHYDDIKSVHPGISSSSGSSTGTTSSITTEQRNVTTTSSLHDLFHFIYTTPPETINWRFIIAIEAVFYHHPKAKVIIHSQTIPSQGTVLDKFQQSNYDLSIQNYSFQELLMHHNHNDDNGQLQEASFLINNTDLQSFLKVLQDNQKNKYWYSHSTDILRLLILEQHGGIYLDTDIHLISPIPKRDFRNILGFQGRGNDKVNGAVMIFDARNRFIQACLKDAISIASKPYDKRLWEIFGPQLLTRHWNDWKNEMSPPASDGGGGGGGDGHHVVKAVPMHVFYPYGIYKTKQCFTTPKEEFNPIQFGSTIAVHLNTGITYEYNYTLAGTVCDEMFKNNCIFCNVQHTVHKVS